MLFSAVANATGERLTISIVTYGGKSDDFRLFRSRLNDWVLTLSDEIPSQAGGEYLRHLRTLDRTTEFSSAVEIDDYWRRSDALQIMYGEIAIESAGTYFVSSHVYLGDLQGSLPHKTILIELPFDVHNYADTYDFHTAVFLYSLAMDAEHSNPQQTPLIATMLKIARDKVEDIKRRKSLGSKAESSLAELEMAIDDAAKHLSMRQ